jgi:hypothetical protein
MKEEYFTAPVVDTVSDRPWGLFSTTNEHTDEVYTENYKDAHFVRVAAFGCALGLV